jgi:DNA-binding MarR family transcriptional regulator
MGKRLLRVYPGFGKGVTGVDAASTEIVVNLIRLGGMLEDAVVSNLRPADISPAGLNTLMILNSTDASLCPSEISARLIRTRGTVTGLLDSLEKRGYIERRPDPEDRRMTRIEITASGRKVLDDVLPGLWRHEARLLGHLTKKDKQALLTLIEKTLQGDFADDAG